MKRNLKTMYKRLQSPNTSNKYISLLNSDFKSVRLTNLMRISDLKNTPNPAILTMLGEDFGLGKKIIYVLIHVKILVCQI